MPRSSRRFWELEAAITADFSTASLTAVSVTGLKVTLPANSLWEFECVMVMNSSDASGVKQAVSGPAGSALSCLFEGEANNSFPGTAQHGVGTLSANALGTVGAANDVIGIVKGFMKVAGTAGDLQMQFAKVTAGTGIVRAGSILRARRLS